MGDILITLFTNATYLGLLIDVSGTTEKLDYYVIMPLFGRQM